MRRVFSVRSGSVFLAVFLLTGVLLAGFVMPAEASPAVVVLDVSSLSQTDTSVQTSVFFVKTFRVGVILDIDTGAAETVSDVFAFQFVLHYDPAYFTAVADPPLASDFFGSVCYVAPPCSENADATVKFGAQTVAGSANWNGLISAGRAAVVTKVDDPSQGPGTVLVALTLLSPEAGKNISVDTLLANVAFELDAPSASPLAFTVSSVIFLDSATQPISGITTGAAVSATISNSPPRALGTVSNLSPQEGENVNFDASTSTDDAGVTGYIWEFGAGDIDGDGQPDSSCDPVAGTCTSPTASYSYSIAGTYVVSLRVRDGAGATGSARDSLGAAIKNDQPSHLNFTITVVAVGSPVLNPIGPKTVDEETLLTFTATATDPTNDPLTFSLGGGSPAGAAIDPSTGVFTWTPTEAQGPGNYPVTVIVSDPGNLQDSETITITVREVNQAPVLTVPSSQTVDEGSALSFTITATDADLPPNTVVIGCTNCGALGANFNSITGEFSWTPTEAQGVGDYTITFTATDNGTPPLSDTESVSVHVNEVNSPPTASFTVSNPTPIMNEVVTFDASASSDPDPGASIVSYQWDFGDGNTTTVSTPTITHKYTVRGPYTVTLTVTDNAATTGTASTTINVVNAPPTITATSDKADARINDPVTLTITYSDADGDPLTVTVNWADGTVDPVTGNTATHSYSTKGGFTISVTVSDGQGDPVSTTLIIVIGDPPTVSFTSQSTAPINVNVDLSITGSDPDGTIASTRINWGDTTIQTFTGLRTSATHPYTSPGTYTVNVTLTDNDGIKRSVTSTVSITRVEPTLTTALDKATANTGETITITITSNDTDGAISSTSINWGDGTSPETSPGQITTATHTYATAGTYTVTVTVSDTSGLPKQQTSTITISVPPEPPSTFPLPGGPIPWAILAVVIVAAALVYFLKIRKPSTPPPQPTTQQAKPRKP